MKLCSEGGSLSPGRAQNTYSVGHKITLTTNSTISPPDNHNGKRPLRVRPDVMGHGRGQQPKRRHQHSHHDGTQTELSTFLGSFANGQSSTPPSSDFQPRL